MRIVYTSFSGRFSDNPRAVYEALTARPDNTDSHLWLLDPRHAAGFPAGTPAVRVATPEAVAALEEADVVVTNNHTDLDPWTKRDGALYLQTWHGTPAKRIHRDALHTPPEAFMAELDAEIARWDYLVTPGGAGTELLRSAFGYTGEVLETGYPRNDVLHGPVAAERRARVRRDLGISDGVTAVLYAPTWRDDEDLAADDVPLGLDPGALVDDLGDGFVLLLRLHYFITHRPAASGERVRDVSGHPDITDLYLAADVLVTDYSSAMFDVAGTGLPVLVYAYDLEHFRDVLRGFYLDLEAEAPGPVLRRQDQLVAALRDLPDVTADHADRYEAFRRRYCPLDDGRATERLVSALWPPGGATAGSSTGLEARA